ncbi:L-threonylcarbamoyladenylate synthase [Thorsellia kenyensis]|uniref:L-threonylcarbamoyladenylate synthase n=1 Tax=Thorsellia kenyensis TaxID=1549888 RepID=A0ABV6C919_9GAMM
MSSLSYIHPENPQPRLVKQAVDVIKNGGVVIYPTDSGYAMGCQIGDKNALERILRIRKIDAKHHFTLMCRDLSELATYAYVDNKAFRMIKNNTPGSYTFILKATKEVPRRLMNEKRKTIGLRVPSNPIALAILEELSEPMMSCSLIIPDAPEMLSSPEDIYDFLSNQVDLVIHGGNLGENPTTVVDLTEDTPIIVRYGIGDASPFEV